MSPAIKLLFAVCILLVPTMEHLHGNEAPLDRPSGKSWSIAVIPDTQYYVNNPKNAPLFTELTNWLADNRERYNIQLALHVGDIVDANKPEQWSGPRKACGC